ncbi:hypothetical protein IL252_03715 [Halomicrobium sp. IBSBa]|uniref:hypothetical protein n=1 Tax=Halomicrobium sp. IBSBa TaxID=2778916 RepID=UPI001ABF1F31|nr:hypothetical protein [Halomicrobium sp. IBSBa]MBO4246927.1 hypothetical protein [Halomicrobium sp. IBSBa]
MPDQGPSEAETLRRYVDRRGVLKSAAVSLTALSSSLAGCSDDVADGSTDPSRTATRRSPTESATATHTETRTPTRAETRTPTRTETPTATRTSTEAETRTATPRRIEPVSTIGSVPIHETEQLPAEPQSSGITGDDQTHALTNRASVSNDSEAHLTVDGALVGTGTLGMNASAAFRTYWRAPESGTYTLTASYWGNGAYEYAPRENRNRDYTLCSETNLAVLTNDRTVAHQTRPDLQRANRGLQTRAAEQLLEFLAYRLVAPYVGVVGSLIARAVINWAIDLERRDPTAGSFLTTALDPYTVEVQFTATAGTVYQFQVTPSVGFAGESHADQHTAAKVESIYHLEGLSVRRE